MIGQERVDAGLVGGRSSLVPKRDLAMQLSTLGIEHRLIGDVAYDAMTKGVALPLVNLIGQQETHAVVQREMTRYSHLLPACRRMDFGDKQGREAKTCRARHLQCDLAFGV